MGSEMCIRDRYEGLETLSPMSHTQAPAEFIRAFLCTEHARLFSPTPWITDQIHLVPRSLFSLAGQVYFGHEALECLQEKGAKYAFLRQEPFGTDTSVCANPFYTIAGRPVASRPCVFNSNNSVEFSAKCGARIQSSPACALQPIGAKHCEIVLSLNMSHSDPRFYESCLLYTSPSPRDS